MRQIIWLCLVVFICVTMPASAQIYRWVDENGATVFSDTPPADATEFNAYDDFRHTTVTGTPQPVERKPQPAVTEEEPQQSPRGKNQVELYVTSWCPYCEKAIGFFKSKNIRVAVYDIEKDREARKRKEELDNSRGVPFAVVNGTRIHGYNVSLYTKALKR